MGFLPEVAGIIPIDISAIDCKLEASQEMPSYSYICKECQTRFRKSYSYRDYDKALVSCPNCESADVRRLIGRVRALRSEDSRFDSLGDPAALEGLEDDPKGMARMMRKMSSEMGEEIGPEFDEVVDRLESGQRPEDIEKELPDLGAGGSGGGFSD